MEEKNPDIVIKRNPKPRTAPITIEEGVDIDEIQEYPDGNDVGDDQTGIAPQG